MANTPYKLTELIEGFDPQKRESVQAPTPLTDRLPLDTTGVLRVEVRGSLIQNLLRKGFLNMDGQIQLENGRNVIPFKPEILNGWCSWGVNEEDGGADEGKSGFFSFLQGKGGASIRMEGGMEGSIEALLITSSKLFTNGKSPDELGMALSSVRSIVSTGFHFQNPIYHP
ncbi:MAG: hypothetical protein WC924_04005 [Candidatus Gracilibacteria bacterium]